MSAADARAAVAGAFGRAFSAIDRPLSVRLVAIAGVLAVVGAFLSVLRGIVVVTGDPTTLYLVAAGAAVAGTVAAGTVRPRVAAIVAVVVGGVGTALYLRSLPGGVGFLVLVAPMLDDATALLSGVSVLRVINADLWAISAAPGPIFLGWYLTLRRRYVTASAVVGTGLALLVLTGDATTAETFVGVAGAAVAAAFGDCDRRGERLGDAGRVVVVVAAMLVLTLVAGALPGALGSALPDGAIGDDDSTMESSLVHAGDSVAIAGSVDLSPERRYTVEADEEAYWRVGTYDRYTGSGWVRTGSTDGYDGPLGNPSGETRTVEQTYTAESAIATLPAAREPTRIDGVPVPVEVTSGGSFEPADTLRAGDSYSVESEVPIATAGELRGAGTDYPDRIEGRYTQLPSDTPERVADRTDRLTAEADNPYDTARVLEHWLRSEYEYSLDVDRPRGDVADAFLFEMEAGYCTYFATTMVTMLRTQGVPARFAVGYTPGEETGDDEWTVRGYNSHAWVEVYVPEHGWIEFDPTPAEPREAAEGAVLEPGDANGTDDPETDPAAANGANETDDGEAANATDITDPVAAADAAAGEDSSLPIPTGTTTVAGFGAIVILAALARRRNAGTRLYRELWLRRLPSGPPEDVVVGAYRRAVYLEGRAGRPKEPGETPRGFLAGADPRLERIGERYERVRYGNGVDRAAAAEARADLEAVIAERTRLPRRDETQSRGPDSV